MSTILHRIGGGPPPEVSEWWSDLSSNGVGDMKPDDFDWPLLARVFAGEASPEEEKRLMGWLEEHPERAREYELLRLAWSRAGEFSPTERASGALERVARRAGVRLERRGGWQAGLVRIAALLVVSVVPLLIWWGVLRDSDISWFSRDGAREGVMAEFTTDRAQRSRITLGDGTVVTLAPESQLRVLEGFMRRSRTVSLTGKAFFEVESDLRHSFIVETEGARTEVTGTSFVIRSGGEGGTEVAVIEGSVSFQPQGWSAVPLSSGEVVRLTQEGQPRVLKGRDMTSYLGWTEGRLSFAATPLSEVVLELERWYDITIEYPEELLGQTEVTATFDNETLDEVVENLALILDLEFARSGRLIRYELDPQRR